MKTNKVVCFVILLLITIFSFGQEQTDSINYKEVNPFKSIEGFFSTIERFPMYPEGEEGIIEHIKSNLNYPYEAKENNIKGTVIIGYLIDIDGSVGEVVVLKSVHPLLDEEAVRVIKLMDKWLPAIQRGSPAKMRLQQSIVFE